MNAPLPSPAPHVPDLDQLEQNADIVRREVDRLMQRAGEAYARLQDIEAEITEGESYAIGKRSSIAHELRVISQQLTVAQTWLVHPADERFGASVRVRGWAEDAMRADGPWRHQPEEVAA